MKFFAFLFFQNLQDCFSDTLETMSSPGHSLGDPAPHQLRPPDGQSPPKDDDQRVVDQTPHHELQPPDANLCLPKPDESYSSNADSDLPKDSANFDSTILEDIENKRLGWKLSGVVYRDNL